MWNLYLILYGNKCVNKLRGKKSDDKKEQKSRIFSLLQWSPKTHRICGARQGRLFLSGELENSSMNVAEVLVASKIYLEGMSGMEKKSDRGTMQTKWMV